MFGKKCSIAVVGTVIWIFSIFVFYIIGLFERPDTFNELGDFLAGVFAPIAFLWLVLGYRQQGEALRKQSQSLELQVKEFKNFVDLERKKRIDKHKIYKPKVKFENLDCTFEKSADGQIKYARFVGNLVNTGVGDAIDVQLRPKRNDLLKVNPQIICEKIVVQACDKVAFNVDIKHENYNPMNFIIEYKDLYEKQYEQEIQFNLLKNKNESFSICVKSDKLFEVTMDDNFDEFSR